MTFVMYICSMNKCSDLARMFCHMHNLNKSMTIVTYNLNDYMMYVTIVLIDLCLIAFDNYCYRKHYPTLYFLCQFLT